MVHAKKGKSRGTKRYSKSPGCSACAYGQGPGCDRGLLLAWPTIGRRCMRFEPARTNRTSA